MGFRTELANAIVKLRAEGKEQVLQSFNEVKAGAASMAASVRAAGASMAGGDSRARLDRARDALLGPGQQAREQSRAMVIAAGQRMAERHTARRAVEAADRRHTLPQRALLETGYESSRAFALGQMGGMGSAAASERGMRREQQNRFIRIAGAGAGLAGGASGDIGTAGITALTTSMFAIASGAGPAAAGLAAVATGLGFIAAKSGDLLGEALFGKIKYEGTGAKFARQQREAAQQRFIGEAAGLREQATRQQQVIALGETEAGVAAFRRAHPGMAGPEMHRTINMMRAAGREQAAMEGRERAAEISRGRAEREDAAQHMMIRGRAALIAQRTGGPESELADVDIMEHTGKLRHEEADAIRKNIVARHDEAGQMKLTRESEDYARDAVFKEIEEWADLLAEGNRIREENLTDEERAAEKIARINELLGEGAMTPREARRAIGQAQREGNRFEREWWDQQRELRRDLGKLSSVGYDQLHDLFQSQNMPMTEGERALLQEVEEVVEVNREQLGAAHEIRDAVRNIRVGGRPG